jgi:glycogen debranching enzyme
MNNLENAYILAKRDLLACFGTNGILAGRHHFDDYWARDSFFASFGCLAIKEHEIVKKT